LTMVEILISMGGNYHRYFPMLISVCCLTIGDFTTKAVTLSGKILPISLV